ncbi:hypothetical protein CAPTEDRAFT_89566 [Capitella teleta]|uniref:Ion transport domain-containing protein n=1 Tax=Capitella teleta TaxID=283909 RepID=R7U742_CAPTE|nr:hypothetical protein CAPTEDRAFT_89566 [Capitella teleta]|eukprot:ELU02190.1 hypothetical protein CAPTEDRAFT_89566 [Capitella teleta]
MTHRSEEEGASSSVAAEHQDDDDEEAEDEEELPYPGFVKTAYYCMSQTTQPRKYCLRLVTWPYPFRISMTVILLNCVTLGMYQPCTDTVCNTTRCKVLEGFDHFIFAFFAIEMVIKLIAMGLAGKETYLAETWNRLDMFIVLAGAVEYAVDTENLSLSAIRTIRVLRPLRAINRIPSMRILVMLLLDTLPMLGNVLLLCFFVFFIFGIIGVQLWAGLLRNRCFLELPENITTPSFLRNYYIRELEKDFICSDPSDQGMTKCSELPHYQYQGRICNDSAIPFNNNTPANDSCVNWNVYYSTCKPGDRNPFQGAISFDNIGLAWVAIFQVISLEGWVDIMYNVQDAHSFWDWIYFVSLIVIGAFFMINLCLVVIATQFSETKKRETERMKIERKRFHSSSTLASNSEPGGCYDEIIKYLAHIVRRARRKLNRFFKLRRGKHQRRVTPEKAISLRRKRRRKKAPPATGGATSGPTPIIASSHPHPQTRTFNAGDGAAAAAVGLLQIAPGTPYTHCSSQSEYECTSDDSQDEDSSSEDWSDDEVPPKKRKCEWRLAHARGGAKLKVVVDSNFFQRGILLAILFNTLSMGIEYHNQPLTLTLVLEYSNIFFSALFAFEMLLKILAEGPFGYIKNGFNVFDGFIVVLSLVELVQGGAGGLSVLRTFRLLRILKLVRFMPALRYQLVIMLRTMDNVATFFALLVLFIFIFSVLGMHLFGGKFCTHPVTGRQCTCAEITSVPCKCERKNFDTLLWSLVTVFQILTQEDWNEVLYNGMSMTSAWAALYFIALMTFGNYVLFNLLVAILVEGFSTEKKDEDKEVEEAQEMLRKIKDTNKLEDKELLVKMCKCKLVTQQSLQDSHNPADNIKNNQEKEHPDTFILRKLDESHAAPLPPFPGSHCRPEGRSTPRSSRTLPPPPWPPRRASRYHSYSECNGHTPLNNQRTLSPQNSIKSFQVLSPQDSLKSGHAYLSRQNSLHSSYCAFAWCPEPKGCFKTRAEYSLYIFSPQNMLRRRCQSVIVRKWFDYSVLFFIALNCITLAMERPDIPNNSLERQFLNIANYVFTVIFAIEMIVKVTAKGFIIGEHAYIKSGWNIMDGCLVFISLVDILITLSASSSPRIFGILRVFRLLRTLRPLRVISRAPGLKLVVQTLLSSLRPIGNIVLICCTFFIIFGILGVQLFKGTFYYCDGRNVTDVKNKTDCFNKGVGYRWVNRKYNFDNLGQALMSLFVLASKDGWVSIMYTGLDAVGVDLQPQENHNEWRLIYFISFLLLVGFFVLNMFVGVVVENFHKCRESQEQEEKARRAAKRAKKLEKKRRSNDPAESKMRQPPYWSPYSKPRLFVHTVISSKYFDLAIAGVIGLNVITMALEYYMMPLELQFALKIFNFFFTSVFILEAVVKVVALGNMRYMKDRWNQLDMAIVLLSIAGIILEEMKSGVIPINPTIIRVMRVLRIARVLKLLKMAKGIRALLDTVVQALPQVGNLGLLFFLLFFIFAALGVELFGRLECTELTPCEGLSKHAHFQDFGIAFLTLFRVATGDNWNGIMKDTLRDNCNAEDDCKRNCCVSPIIAPVFFVVFVLMAQFVLVNVVVAVLMKHLEVQKSACSASIDFTNSMT